MTYPEYHNRLVDCTKPFDASSVKGKSVVLTGGASGMGEQTVRAFIKAGAFVTFGDLSAARGQEIAADLGPNAKFVQCDVTSFDDQLKLFKAAKESSPENSIDVVVACAGIAPQDTVFNVAGDGDADPVAPNLLMMDVNVTGVLYSLKLAKHFFLRNPEGPNRDRCFVIFSSAAGYQDVPGGPMYQAGKFAVRGLMRCTRRTTSLDGIRANVLAPWFVSTGLLSEGVQDHVKKQGVAFADAADAASAVLKIASDTSINGRSFAIVPRDQEAPLGYIDQDVDDFDETTRLGKSQKSLVETSQLTSVDPDSQKAYGHDAEKLYID